MKRAFWWIGFVICCILCFGFAYGIFKTITSGRITPFDVLLWLNPVYLGGIAGVVLLLRHRVRR